MSSHHLFYDLWDSLNYLRTENSMIVTAQYINILLSAVDAVFAGRRAFFTKVIYLKIKDGRGDEKVGRPSGVK